MGHKAKAALQCYHCQKLHKSVYMTNFQMPVHCTGML